MTQYPGSLGPLCLWQCFSYWVHETFLCTLSMAPWLETCLLDALMKSPHCSNCSIEILLGLSCEFEQKRLSTALGLDFGLNSSYKSKKTLHIDKLLLSIYYEKYVSLNTTIFQNSFKFVQYLLLLKFVLYKNSEEFSSKKEIGLIEKKVFLLKNNFLTITVCHQYLQLTTLIQVREARHVSGTTPAPRMQHQRR